MDLKGKVLGLSEAVDEVIGGGWGQRTGGSISLSQFRILWRPTPGASGAPGPDGRLLPRYMALTGSF